MIFFAQQAFVLVFTFEVATVTHHLCIESMYIQKYIKQYVHVRRTSLTKDDRFCSFPTRRLTIISRYRCF